MPLSEGKRENTQMVLRFHDGGGSVYEKCSRHDIYKRRFVCRGGVCPFCVHERLSSLCPDCAHDLPCSCTPRASVSAVEGVVQFAGIGSVGRVADLIESEQVFRRSNSVAVPFIWSTKPKPVLETGSDLQPGRGRSVWSLFRGNRGESKTIVRKSSSVVISDAGERLNSPALGTSKGNGWYFRSPIKVFRHSRVSRILFQQRSPLYRG